MLFTEIKSPENKIYRAVRLTKIVGVNLENTTVTLFIEDEKMPRTSLTFDTYEEALEQYDSIMEELRNTLV